MSRLLRLLLTPLRHPLPWLLLQVVSVFLALQAGRLLELEIVPDTASYAKLTEARAMEQALGSHRTYGYPLFLKSMGHRIDGEVDGDHARHHYRVFRKVPAIHALVFLASILLFWWSVRMYTGSPWLAFAMATPLPYLGIWELVRRVQPDFLAAALALVTVSFLILLATRPRRALIWAGLTIALFLTYQVRPGYLFLVALLPLMGPVLRIAQGESPRRLLRFGLGLLGATILPLLLFCGVRWFAVRDFGLVSFGGHASIGIAASFLDRNVVNSLDRNKGLANDILKRRRSREMKLIPLGGDTLAWHGQHNENVWRIAVPEAHARVAAARERQRPGKPPLRDTTIEVNQRLTQLSVDIFRRKPLHYLKWVRDSFLFCLNRALADEWIRWPAILIALSVPFALLAGAGPRLLGMQSRDLERRRRFLALAALGLGFFLAHALLVILVDVPYQRFVYGMTLLLPPVLCGALFELWRPESRAAA